MSSVRTQGCISGAMRSRRSNGARARQRRRRSIVSTSIAALFLALAGAFSIAGFSGVDLATAGVQRARSLSDLLAGRSPGERTQGQLSNTKHKRVLAERQIEPGDVKPMPDDLTEALSPLVPATVTIDAPPQVPDFTLTAPLSSILEPPGGGVVPPGGGITPPGGGSPPGGGGTPPGGPGIPPSQPPDNPGQPPALPEPGTWLTMILGFGVMGWTLKRLPPVRASQTTLN